MQRERLTSTREAGWVWVGAAAGLTVFVVALALAAYDDALDDDGTTSVLTGIADIVVIGGLTAALAMLVRGLGLLARARAERKVGPERPERH